MLNNMVPIMIDSVCVCVCVFVCFQILIILCDIVLMKKKDGKLFVESQNRYEIS